MEDIRHVYMRYNKYMMCIIGQWPYQSTLERILVTGIFAPIVTAQAVLQGAEVVTALKYIDIDIFMEGSSPFVISLMCLCKFVNCIFSHKQMKYLFDTMLQDCDVYREIPTEFNLLCRNYETAKKVTIYYAASLYGTMTSFLLVPTMVTAADAMGFYNISGDRPLVFRFDNFMDTDKFYYILLIHSYFGTLGFVTIVVGIDCMTMFYVQHECGLCEILGHRLQNCVNENWNVELHPERHEDEAYQNIKQCVLLHQHILEYAKILEDANTVTNIFQLGLNMIGISFTLFQAVMKLQLHPNESLRFIMFSVCLLSVVLLGTWPGQQLTDHSARIFENIPSGKWYLSSISSRKLLNIMLLRSLNPIRLTAGKLYVLNLKNFSAVVRTSFSYFTVMCSLQ